MFGQFANVKIEGGVYSIQLPVEKLNAISDDVRERLFTKRKEKKINYDDVRQDLDAFMDTLNLSRSSTPSTSAG